MADISKYLTDILNAVYGEEVRGSIYNAIDIINKVGERVLTIGTAVNAANSSTTGYYTNSLYLNSNTYDLWKCTGSAWAKVGNMQGSSITSILKTSSSGLTDTYTVNLSNGSTAGTFRVTNGNKIRAGTEVTSTNTSTTINGVSYGVEDVYINVSTNDIWKCIGTNSWERIGNIKGEQGIQGIQGYSITDVSKTSQSGLTDTYTIRNSNNTIVGTFTVTNGADGYHITEVRRTSQSGLTDTYSIFNSNGDNVGNFTVTNGERGPQGYYISEVTKTGESGLVDTYTMKNNNNDTVGTFNVTNGAKGDQGERGPQGYSVTNVSKTGSVGLVDTYTIRNSNNDNIGTFTVTNGEKGDTGSQGPNGFSPTVTSSKSGKVTTITITDITGPHTMELRDGADGSGTGDMLKETYDKDDDGVVDEAKKLSVMDNIPTAGSGNAITSGGVYSQIGDINNLKTSLKDNLVNSINEVKDSIPSAVEFDDTPVANSNKAVKSGGLYSEIGNLNELTTENKTNLVAAINEAAESGGASEDYVQKSGDTMTGPLIIYDQTDTDSTAAEDKYRLDLGYRKSGSTIGLGSMVMGREATSSGIHSIAEGNSCVATGNYSSARGSGTTASGNFSVADGNGSQATALGAHVSGLYNRATQEYQMVVGKYNNYNDDENHADAIFEVGNGTAISNRSNALQVMKNGDLRIQGDIYLQDGTSLADYIRSIVSGG